MLSKYSAIEQFQFDMFAALRPVNAGLLLAPVSNTELLD